MTDAKRVTLPLADVEIDRGRETIRVLVPLHEAEVLKAVHGPGNARVLTEDTGEEIELSADADEEFNRLTRKYGAKNMPNPVLLAFRDGPKSLSGEGFSVGRGQKEEVAQSSDRGAERAKAAKAAKDDSKKAGAK